MPAIVKIITVFVSVLALTRIKVHLGAALILGGFAMSLWGGQGASETGAFFFQALLQPDLWLLLVVIVLIIEVGRYVTEERNAKAIVSATERWGGRHGRIMTMTAMPAVIGLIPMPGGALLSAPFVGHAGGGSAFTNHRKSAVNYWFRHIWEYWWPLYPGVIIAMQTFHMIETWEFVAAQIIFTPMSLLSGYVFLIRPHIKELASEQAVNRDADYRRVLFLMAPLVAVVLAVLIFPAGLRLLVPSAGIRIRKLLAMILGLLLAVGLILRDKTACGKRGIKTGRLFSTLLTPKSISVMFVLFGVLVFNYMLQASGLLPLASHELVESGIPVLAAVVSLPFLAGLVTGVAFGFTGTAFPLVVGLMSASGSGLAPVSTLVLAYGFGYMGMILSPVHLCLLVTRDHFESNLPAIYREIAPCVLVMLVGFSAVYFVLAMMGL